MSYTASNDLKVTWTAQDDGQERYGFPILWFSSALYRDKPITVPFTQLTEPDMLYPICVYYGATDPIRQLTEFCFLMMRSEAIAQTSFRTSIGITDILSSGTPTRYNFASRGVTNAIFFSWGVLSQVLYGEAFTGITGSSNEPTRLKQIKELYNWDRFIVGLKAKGISDAEIDFIRQNSCVTYITGGGEVSSKDESLLGLFSRSGSGYGIWYGRYKTDYVRFHSVALPKARVLPQQFYYKTNSYANVYLSKSLCVRNLAFDFNDGKGWQDQILPTCIWGMNSHTTNNSGDKLQKTDWTLRRAPLEYVRRDFKRPLTVFTNLNFEGNLSINPAHQEHQPITFAQLPDKNTILRSLVYEK